MLIKKYKAGEVVFLQDQVPALVGVLIFLGQFVCVGLIAQGRTFLIELLPVGCSASLQSEALGLGCAP